MAVVRQLVNNREVIYKRDYIKYNHLCFKSSKITESIFLFLDSLHLTREGSAHVTLHVIVLHRNMFV